MPEITYLNGNLLDRENAVISLDDRAFIFGDGIYEYIRSYNGRLFSVEPHLDRLAGSARAVYLKLPEVEGGLGRLIEELYQKSSFSNAMVYLQVTRGSAPRNHLFALDIKPNLFIKIREIPYGAYDFMQGIRAITLPDMRWEMCHIKSTSLVASIMAKHQARLAGAGDAIFLRAGTVTEAPSSNVFMVENGKLYTHPEGCHILSGITRHHILQLAREKQMDAFEEKFGYDRLMSAQEVFFTDSSHDIYPVTEIDGQKIGDGSTGRMTMELKNAFMELVSR